MAQQLLLESLKSFEELTIHNEEHPFVLSEVARVFALQGKKEEAIDYFKKSYAMFLKHYASAPHFWVPLLEIIKIHQEEEQKLQSEEDKKNSRKAADEIRDLILKNHSNNLKDLEKVKGRFQQQVQFITQN